MTVDETTSRIIEWKMLDKRKFLSMCAISSFSIRFCLYPVQLIKTRLQIQKRADVYGGFRDAAVKIFRSEGVPGLYKGFWINSMQIPAGVLYVTANEGCRHVLSFYDASQSVKALAGGGAASLAAQTVAVPMDVVSQHLAVSGLHGQIGKGGRLTRFDSPLVGDGSKPPRTTSSDIVRFIYKNDGFKGFYRGYLITVLTQVPYSAIWWSLYQSYQAMLIARLPDNVSNAPVQFVSGTLSSATTTLLTNPLDVIRTRFQVLRSESVRETFRVLWREEGIWVWTKGISARLIQNILVTSTIIMGYETIKRLTVKDEFKNSVHW